MLNTSIQGQPEVEKFLTGLTDALDTQAILDEGAAILFYNTFRRFLQETDPSGQKWIPSKAFIKRKGTRGGGTLYDTGKLFKSIQLYAESYTSRAIGTNVTNSKGFPYGIVHQFGSKTLPQRQFLGFGNDDLKAMSDLIIKRLKDKLGAI